jgi:hypothetical protein
MNQLIIKPRRSGKTSLLYYKFSNDPKGIFVTLNMNNLRATHTEHIKRPLMITQEQMMQGNVHTNPDINPTFYLDEYFHFRPEVKKSLFNVFLLKGLNFIAIGTPTTQYSHQDIDDVKEWWTLMGQRKSTGILKTESQMVEAYGEDLMYSLIVAPGVTITAPIGDEMKKFLSKEQYEREVLGNLYKGE